MIIQEKLDYYKNIFENYLDQRLKELPNNELSKAIVYSIKNGGKRLRPCIMLITAELLNVDIKKVLPFAYALELIHSSSLVHDDLPALDNDDLRRGKPSCHKKFGEAEAILCGDAMLNLAYEIATQNTTSLNDIKCVSVLASLSGHLGMLGGQYLDVTSEKRRILDKKTLLDIQKQKTGALFIAPLQIVSILADSIYLENLKEFGLNLGIAFQMVDDVLDEVSNKEVLGKSIGKDKDSGKLTIVAIYGLEKAKEMAKQQTQKAINSLNNINELALLKELANYLLVRIK